MQTLHSPSQDTLKEYLSHLHVPHPQTIPLQLRTGKRHVIWLPEERGDKIAKPPYNARILAQSGNYVKASATNPKSWSTFPQAMKALQEHRDTVGGIGRVLTDGIMLIDIDHSWNRETRTLHPAAREIAELIKSYRELSPGDGLHLFPRAKLPEGAKSIYVYKGIKVELYAAGRYSTMTGIPVPDLPHIPDVQDQQAEVNALVERLSQWEKENTGVCWVCGAHDPQRPARDGAHQNGDQAEPCPCQLPNGSAAQQPKPRRSANRNEKPLQSALRNEHQAPAVVPAIGEKDLTQAEQLVLEKAGHAKNKETFWALWNGGDPHHRGDTSRADFDLILLLLYWTGDSATNDCSAQVERLFLASGRNRPELYKISAKKRYTKLQLSIYNARCKKYGVVLPEPEPLSPAPSAGPAEGPTPEGEARAQEQKRQPQRRRYQVINYAYEWMTRDFDQTQWNAELYDLALQAKLTMKDHFEEGGRQLLVTALPPGTGKSHAFGDLCDEMDLAVIVPRHELIEGVPGYRKQRHIQTATQQNCPTHEKHHRLAALGYNTRPVHKAHDQPCAYVRQYQQTGSAIYQIAHSETSYIGQHEGIAIDEWNLPDWLHEKTYTVERLARAAHQFSVDAPASRYLMAWQAVLTELAQEYGEGSYQGRAVLDLLNARLWKNHREDLAQLLGTLNKDYHATDVHPWPSDIDDEQLPEVVLPVLFYVVLGELVKWQRDMEDFNSCMRVVVTKQKRAMLHITTPRTINATSFEGTRRAIGMADATADREILSHWYGSDVQVERLAKDPLPHMRHYHLAERCAKRSLQAKHGRDQARVIRKLKYFLKRFDPTGEKTQSGKVGLITYLGNKEAVRQALGIPEGRTAHFWAARGSNALEQCEILLLVGTPTLAPETMYRIARTVYRDDPRPIVEGSTRDEQGHPRYLDARVQVLSDYLTGAELTQCAHRHRPLRYDGRLTISLCDADIDYLPVTHFISQMPRLTDDGEDYAEVKQAEDDTRLDQARHQLEVQRIPLGVHRLGRAAGVSTDTAGRYLREWRATQTEASTQEEHTHTHQCSHTVPENPDRDTISNTRYERAVVGSESPPVQLERWPGTEISPPSSVTLSKQELIERYHLQHGEPCQKCACALQRDLAGEWACCRCYPQKGYHQYSDQVDSLYPRKHIHF